MPLRSARRLAPVLAVALAGAASASAQPLNRLRLDRLTSSELVQSGIGRYGSFASLPDVTGDGVADLAVGAAEEGNGRGNVYIYDLVAKQVVRTIASPQSVQAERFGRIVMGLPDLDGDGRGDLAVCAGAASVGELAGAGRVYVLSGATGAVIRTLTSPHPAAGGAFGFRLVGVPDVDGDGVADLAVGAPDENAPDAAGDLQIDVGRAYVYSGATGALLQEIVSLNPVEYSPFAFGLSTRGSDIGAALAGLPDVDGDGHGELVVGAPGEWTQDFDSDPAKYDGRLYVWRSGGMAPTVLRSPNAADRGNFSTSVAATPDFDGDGKADILVGAPGENLTSAGDDEGRAYLVSGATGQPFRAFASPEPTDESAFGVKVGVVPSLSLGGKPDVFVTDPTSCCDKMPAFYVFDGQTSKLIYSLELPYFTYDLNDVVGLPDVDGDGRGDFAVGMEVGSSDGVEQIQIFSGDLTRAEVEPNDNRAEAQQILGPTPRVIEGNAAGSDYGYGGAVSYTPDGGTRQPIEDVFRVDLLAPGVEITLTGLTDDVDLYLFDQDLTLVELSGNGADYDDDGDPIRADDESISLPTLKPGTYYIGVDFYGRFGGTNNAGDWSPYTLTVTGALEAATDAGDRLTVAGVEIAAPRPNPFRQSAEVAFTLDAPGPARLSVLDVLGREVAVLSDGDAPAGERRVTLDGQGLAAGVYVLRLQTAAGVVTRRITRAR